MAFIQRSAFALLQKAEKETLMLFSPHARLYSFGSAGLKILPWKNRHRDAVGIYFRLNLDGSETILWKKKLVIYPQEVMFYGGYVITLDTLYSSQQEHAIVIYGPEGQVIIDLALADFLSKQEIEEYAVDPDSFDWLIWRQNVDISLLSEPNMELRLHFYWGKILGIFLETGYMIQYWPPKPIASAEWSETSPKQYSAISSQLDWIPKDSSKFGIYSEKRLQATKLIGSPAVFETPVYKCPRCAVPMIIKIDHPNQYQVKKFYVCPNYKDCQQYFPAE